ncbi:MAG: site-specific integrase [Magnetococcus sp. DMHC-1]
MPVYRRKKSSVWYVTFSDANGKRTRKATGTQDRKEAEFLEAKWKLEVHHAKNWNKQPMRTFDELMLLYLQSIKDVKKSAQLDFYSAKPLYRFFSGKYLNEISGVEISQYIRSRKAEGRGDHTIRRELALFSVAVSFVRKELNWDIQNPISGRNLREPEGRVRWINQKEAELLISSALSEPKAPYLADFIRLALNTGCRKSELLSLEWSCVDLESCWFHLKAEKTKSGKGRSIPINETSKAVFIKRLRFRLKYCPESPWVFSHANGNQIRSLRTSFETACRRSGLSNFRIHDLRHTCAAWLVSAGVPLPEVRDLLGHHTIQMTEKYAHLAPDNVRSAVAVLDRAQNGLMNDV